MVGVGVLGKGKVGIGRKGWGMEKGLGGPTKLTPLHPTPVPHPTQGVGIMAVGISTVIIMSAYR